MNREGYFIFSPGKLAGLEVPNRLVRSTTWDPSILNIRQVTEDVIDLYHSLALGGVGTIITGGFPVYRERFQDEGDPLPFHLYTDLRIRGLEKVVQAVHETSPGCKIIARLEVGYVDATPSSLPTLFSREPVRELSLEEIQRIIDCFISAISDMRDTGFDGVQLHAAHGGLLSRFLSPLTNHRQDKFGGCVKNRVMLINEIITGARKKVGSYPILIKINCTDYLDGGVDIENYPELAMEITRVGVDAIELSGGMWECLFRPEEELGFRPVPAPASHTRIQKADQQSYFLRYAERIELPVPLILVGGNRDIELLEAILQEGKVGFSALCRPLIREPGLPNRWRAGIGSHLSECVSCNSCIYAMYMHPGKPQPDLVSCICKNDKKQHHSAQKWLARWQVEMRKSTL